MFLKQSETSLELLVYYAYQQQYTDFLSHYDFLMIKCILICRISTKSAQAIDFEQDTKGTIACTIVPLHYIILYFIYNLIVQ